VADQPRYLNAVGEAWCAIGPTEMLEQLQRIEADFGRNRIREVRRGPRTLDLDILLCGDQVLLTESLSIPHALMAERLFVLVPLLELDPGVRDPRSGQPFSAARAALEKAPGGDGGVYLHPDAGYTDSSKKEA
jgi:2-amino-4-hydroxy-6-hydroxymethyldihydropteridine diphosphokinase